MLATSSSLQPYPPIPLALIYEDTSESPHISAIQPAAAKYGPNGIGGFFLGLERLKRRLFGR